ncbi:DUF2252 domain-containing protein [Kitasatospora sp. NBC_01250]|uniref:DUF2252 domain-containing protein n=1 Tax=Kitasatospora sp. NBC_01250 TaxID=2903571 RepID=UPI002E309561|nr:DUF2252 domain-containing protein [Kitasatospora sp. NBC_01250]
MNSPTERARHGRAVRQRVARGSHGRWTAAANRPDPLGVLQQEAADRVVGLLPIRYGRMVASPFAFFRGAAAVMAADLAAVADTGLTVQLCGDAHLLNFGVFASPERALVFDVNDFDETLPGPFEWDVKRLAASLAVAARQNGHSDQHARRAARAAVQAYRLAMRRLAGMGELAVWYERLDAAAILPLVSEPGRRKRVEANLGRARGRTSLQALGKLTEVRDGHRCIVDDPPLLEPVGPPELRAVGKIFAEYRGTLPEERRLLLDRYRFVDAARKVVGVGSVGTRCFVLLLTGRDEQDPLFLQIKEAGPSVLQDYLPAADQAHQGHRVVAGQRLMQAAGDIFLGWMTGPAGRHFYCRQLRDMKGSADVETMDPGLLRQYAELCGAALARAHARTGDRIAVAAYLGSSDTFDRAVAEFALHYADQNTRDHGALRTAVSAGDIPATEHA